MAKTATKTDKAQWSFAANIIIHTDDTNVTRVIVQPENGATFYLDFGTSPLDRDDEQHAINTALGRFLTSHAVADTVDEDYAAYTLEWEG